MRLRAAILVALAAPLVGAAPAAHAASGIQVVVGEEVKTFDAAQLQSGADIVDRPYTVDGLEQPITGVSLRAALVSAGVDPASSSGVTVQGADGRRLQILEPELADPPPFPQGPVVLWVEGNVTKLLLPDGGTRTSRVIASAPDEPLRLAPEASDVVSLGVSTGLEMTVTAGESVYFAAIGTGTGAAGLRYTWNFGDGTTKATGPRSNAAHAFRRPGVYQVVITASDGELGGTATVAVTVEPEEPADEPEKQPEKGTGTTAGDGGGTSTGTSGGTSGGTGSGTGAAGGYVAPAPVTPTSPAPSSTPAPVPDPEPAKRPKPKREEEPPAPDEPEPELEQVEGVVLGASPTPPAAAPAAAASAGLTPSTTTDEDGELGVPWVALAIVLAFFSGLTAARVQRRRWAPRARR